MPKSRSRPLPGEAQKVPWCALFLLVAFTSAATAMQLCARATVSYRVVANCLGQGHRVVPEFDLSTEILLLDSNKISVIDKSSFPRVKSLESLHLRLQRGRSLHVGEEAFQNIRANLSYLDLGGNVNFTFHPAAFRGLPKLEELLLDHNGLEESVLEERYFQDLVSLKRLDLSGNVIRRLRPDSSFLSLKKLTRLQLEGNMIQALCGNDLKYLKGHHLALLNLSNNPLRSSQDCSTLFQGITFGALDVSSRLWTMGEAGHFFTTLKGIKIRQLKVQHLGKGSRNPIPHVLSPTVFSGLSSSGTVALDMSYGFLGQLPASAFSGLPDLTTLILRSNQINYIHGAAFAGLKRLQTLDLSANRLRKLSADTLRSLRSSALQKLILKSNRIGGIQPDALVQLNSLETLDLENNMLSAIPKGELPALVHLKLGGNRIENAEGLDQIGKKLAHVDLSSNVLSDLGNLWAVLEKIPTLRSLNVSRNRLERLSTIGKGLIHLRELDLSHNALGTIWAKPPYADIFQNMAGLVSLSLSSNHLRILPGGILRRLGSLQALDLSGNGLSQLAEDALQGVAKTLRQLSLQGNPVKSLSPSAFGPLAQLRALNLEGLALACNCGLAGFQAWMRQGEGRVSGVEFALPCTPGGSLLSPAVLLARFLHEKCGGEPVDTLQTF